jgi:hypothetical protein
MNEGKLARDDAMAAVDANADPDWKDEADEAIRDMARRRAYFTAEDVFEVGKLRRPREGRAMGPAMRRAQRDKVIEPTDRFSTAARTSNHARPVRVWRSIAWLRR